MDEADHIVFRWIFLFLLMLVFHITKIKTENSILSCKKHAASMFI